MQHTNLNRLIFAGIASIALHILLLASPGQLRYGFSGNDQQEGNSALSRLAVRLTPAAAEAMSSVESAASQATTITAPHVDAAQDQRTVSIETGGINTEPSAADLKRGEAEAVPSPKTASEAVKLGLPLLPQVRYYSAKELDVRPQPAAPVNPTYPELAIANRISGKVVVDVLINEKGEVDDVVVLRAEPAGVFEEAAIAAWRAARFTPGFKTSAAVKSRISLEMSFDAAQALGASRGMRQQY